MGPSTATRLARLHRQLAWWNSWRGVGLIGTTALTFFLVGLDTVYVHHAMVGMVIIVIAGLSLVGMVVRVASLARRKKILADGFDPGWLQTLLDSQDPNQLGSSPNE